MSFQAPWWLLALLAVVALAGFYVLLQRRRQKYAARFTNVALLGALVPKRPGWRRHLAFGLVVLGGAPCVHGLCCASFTTSTLIDDEHHSGSGGWNADMIVQIGGFESVSIVDRIRPNRARLIEVWVERSKSKVLRCLLGQLLFTGKVVRLMFDRWPSFGFGGLVCRSESHGKFSVQTKLLLGSKVGDRECFRTPLTATAAGHESRARRIWFQTCVLGRIWIQV